MSSVVDTHIRCFLKNKVQLIRNEGVCYSGSSCSNVVPPEILVSQAKRLDCSPEDKARQLCMQMISLATSKGFCFYSTSLLLYRTGKKNGGKIVVTHPVYCYNGGSILLAAGVCPWVSARPCPCGNFENRAAIFNHGSV